VAWFKVDDKFHSHPKTITVSLRALGLWVKAGSWCSDQLTDGAVPTSAIKALGGSLKDARELVASGLWDECETGFQFHDWLNMNPSRVAVEEERAKNAQRMAEWRSKKKTGTDLRAV